MTEATPPPESGIPLTDRIEAELQAMPPGARPEEIASAALGFIGYGATNTEDPAEFAGLEARADAVAALYLRPNELGKQLAVGLDAINASLSPDAKDSPGYEGGIYNGMGFLAARVERTHDERGGVVLEPDGKAGGGGAVPKPGPSAAKEDGRGKRGARPAADSGKGTAADAGASGATGAGSRSPGPGERGWRARRLADKGAGATAETHDPAEPLYGEALGRLATHYGIDDTNYEDLFRGAEPHAAPDGGDDAKHPEGDKPPEVPPEGDKRRPERGERKVEVTNADLVRFVQELVGEPALKLLYNRVNRRASDKNGGPRTLDEHLLLLARANQGGELSFVNVRLDAEVVFGIYDTLSRAVTVAGQHETDSRPPGLHRRGDVRYQSGDNDLNPGAVALLRRLTDVHGWSQHLVGEADLQDRIGGVFITAVVQGEKGHTSNLLDDVPLHSERFRLSSLAQAFLEENGIITTADWYGRTPAELNVLAGAWARARGGKGGMDKKVMAAVKAVDEISKVFGQGTVENGWPCSVSPQEFQDHVRIAWKQAEGLGHSSGDRDSLAWAQERARQYRDFTPELDKLIGRERVASIAEHRLTSSMRWEVGDEALLVYSELVADERSSTLDRIVSEIEDEAARIEFQALNDYTNRVIDGTRLDVLTEHARSLRTTAAVRAQREAEAAERRIMNELNTVGRDGLTYAQRMQRIFAAMYLARDSVVGRPLYLDTRSRTAATLADTRRGSGGPTGTDEMPAVTEWTNPARPVTGLVPEAPPLAGRGGRPDHRPGVGRKARFS